jgi:hypothetical protein
MRSIALFACVALVAVACSAINQVVPTAPAPTTPSGGYPGWPPNVASDLIPIPVSTELVVGPNRVLVILIDQKNTPMASPTRPVTLNFYNLTADPSKPATSAQAVYLPTIATLPGLYRAQATFSAAGDWGLETVTTEADGSHRTGRMIFNVLDHGSTPSIGDPAPSTPTPTATTADGIAHISSDSAPDPDFYKLSESDALAQHKPFVIIFATPAFCRTATCGPTLNIVKGVAANYKDKLTFIHIEPYELTYTDGTLQPVLSEDNLPIPVDATNIWGLPTEPYTFVVNSQGKITAKFEGIVAPEELQAAFDADS